MSIEKKLTYLKNTKALIRKKLNRFGINVSSENTFRSYVDFLDEILNRYPKSRGQGTSITLENTIEAQFTIFDVEGNSEQETTEGKNKLSFTENTISYAGVTTNISETKMKFNGKMASVTNIFNSIREDKVVPAGTYKLSYTKLSGSTSGSGDWAIYFNFYNANGTRIANNNFASNESETVKDLVLSEDVAYYNYYAYCNSTSLEFNNLELGFMIEPGTTATNYEPYTGGIASPNPNYEQPIESAGDNENLFNIQTIVKGRLDNGEIGYADNVENLTLNKDSFSFTTNANYRGVTSDFIKISKDFIVSYDNLNTEFVATVACYDKNKVWLGTATITGADDQKYRQYAIVNNTAYVRVYFYLVTAGTITVKKPKLEKGNKATPYSPYGMGSINEKISNKNLFVIKNYSKSGWIVTIDNPLKGMPTGDYTISCQNKSSINAGIRTYFSNEPSGAVIGNLFTDFQFGNTIMFRKDTLTQEQLNAKYLILYFNSANGSQSVLEDMQIMIEPGSTTTPYVPHEEQDYPIFVQQPFRSNKDKTIRDKFVIKSDNKKYERHYIGEVVLNGTENIARELISNNFYKFYINNIENVDYGDANYVPQILCNKLIAVARTPLYLNTQGISSGNGNLQIYTDETKNMTVSEFKTWLENNNLIVNYLKTIPTDLPCTEEQIQQLENKPSTYKDFTIIQSEDETPAYLEVAGLKED